MAKDPAFLFYPGDWLGGTMGMSFEEKGAYFELLMLQFNRGHMTSQVIGQAVGQLWDNIKDKFTQDDVGLWYNKRLETEKNNRKTFTNSRNNNLLGKNQHTKKDGHKRGHTSSRMEDENINENEIKDLDENKDRVTGKGNPIVPKMCKVWYDKFPTYTADKENDFAGMGRVLQFIYRQAPNPKNIEESSTQEKIINTLHLISDQVEKDNFWVNKPIKSIANNIQEFYNNIKNPVNGNSGSKKGNGKVTGEQLNTSFTQFHNKGK